MPLTEAEVVRYSRQILLAQVGGEGQARLLASGAQLAGSGAALMTAAAYLEAGGITVRNAQNDKSPVMADEVGFLLASADVGRHRGGAIQAAIGALSSEQREPQRMGCLGEVPAEFTGAAPWVALGWRGNRGCVVYRSEAGCSECFQANLVGLSRVPANAVSVLVGTMGALAFQRLCLKQSEDLGVVWVDASGEAEDGSLQRCPRCK
jgi:hypothetical protein